MRGAHRACSFGNEAYRESGISPGSSFLLIGILGVHPIPVVELGSYRIVEGNLVGIHLVIAVVALFGTFCGRVIFLFSVLCIQPVVVFIHGVEVGYFIQQDIRAIDELLAKHLYAAGVGSAGNDGISIGSRVRSPLSYQRIVEIALFVASPPLGYHRIGSFSDVVFEKCLFGRIGILHRFHIRKLYPVVVELAGHFKISEFVDENCLIGIFRFCKEHSDGGAQVPGVYFSVGVLRRKASEEGN